MVKVAVLGAGFMGKMHSECYKNLSNAKLIAIGDVNLGKAEELATKYAIQCSPNPDELIKRKNIDLIDICLPTFLHKEYAVKAALAGKHILCEKPIALNLEDADEMVKEADRAGVKFMVGQVIRFWPEYVKLKGIYDNKKLGKMLSISLTRLFPSPDWSWNNWMLDPEKSGSALIDLHIHDTDYLLYLLGEPSSLFSQGTKTQIGYGHIFTIFTFPQGIVASCEGGWDIKTENFPSIMAFRAVFEKGVVEFNSRKKKTLSIYQREKEVEYPDAQKGLLLSADTGGNISQLGGYFSEIKYFINCIENDKLPKIAEAKSARNSLRVALMERESVERGETIKIKDE